MRTIYSIYTKIIERTRKKSALKSNITNQQLQITICHVSPF